MSKTLKESQDKLDSIEKQIVANKFAISEMRQKARELRDKYIAEQKVREDLLKKSLSKEGEN